MVIAYFDHYPEMAVARLRSASLLPGTAPGAKPFCSPYPTIPQVKAAAVWQATRRRPPSRICHASSSRRRRRGRDANSECLRGRSLNAFSVSHAVAILIAVIAGGYPNVPIPDRVTVVIVATIAAINEDPAVRESLMHNTPVETGARKGTRHCSEAGGAKTVAGGATGKSDAVASAEASAAVTTASAAMTASGNCVIRTEDQDRTYECGGNTTVHCYLHRKSRVLPCELLPKAVAGNQVKSGVLLDRFTELLHEDVPGRATAAASSSQAVHARRQGSSMIGVLVFQLARMASPWISPHLFW